MLTLYSMSKGVQGVMVVAGGGGGGVVEGGFYCCLGWGEVHFQMAWLNM